MSADFDNARVTEASCDALGLHRREFLLGSGSLVAAGAAAGLLASSSTTPAEAQTPQRPHILYIIADDMGWKDCGFHGSDIKTPNLDKLADTGAKLEQFYALPMCTPTRAALMTGRYPLRYGLQTGVIPAAGRYSLPLDEYLLPQLLKDAGYTTIMSGKWHLGHAKKDFWPNHRGFDSFYGATVGEIDHFKHSSHGVGDWYRNNKAIKEEGFDNTLFGKEAVRVINEHDPKTPLFLYLAFTAPHTPFQAPQKYIDLNSHIPDENRRKYAAMVSCMDDEIGNTLAALEKRGMRDNTLIIFQSDNGGVLSATFAGDSKVSGKLPADNGPYRDGKGTLFEGGTRVVALANWPGKIKPGTVDGMMHVADIYPTLAGLAGAKLGKNKPLDGMDMWPMLSEGKPSPRSEIVYNVDPLAGAVRRGDWKLIWKGALPQKVALFDLSKDKSETTNLADKNPEKVKELQGRITELAGEMAQPLLLMEAIRLTFFSPPEIDDASEMFNVGD
jgi:arylsulfatase A-like enzyme